MYPIPVTVSIYETVEDIQLAICNDCHAQLGHPYPWQGFAEASATCCICGKPNADATCADERRPEPGAQAAAPKTYRTLRVEPIFLELSPVHLNDTPLNRLTEWLQRRISRSDGA